MVDLKPPNASNVKSPVQSTQSTGATITSISPYLKPSYDEAQFIGSHDPDYDTRPHNMVLELNEYRPVNGGDGADDGGGDDGRHNTPTHKRSEDTKQIDIRHLPAYIHRSIAAILSQVTKQSTSKNLAYTLAILHSLSSIFNDEDLESLIHNRREFNSLSVKAKSSAANDLMANTVEVVSFAIVADTSASRRLMLHVKPGLYTSLTALSGKLGIPTYMVVVLCMSRTLAIQEDGVIHMDHRSKAREVWDAFRSKIHVVSEMSELFVRVVKEEIAKQEMRGW